VPPLAWDAEGLRSKARLYFERAFDTTDHSDPLFSFWCHLALELLARAAIADVHPALLSGTKRDGLYYGLGLTDGPDFGPESISSGTVYDLCLRFIDDFGTAERATCEESRQRRNAELHSALATFENLPRGWLGRFFAACRILAQHMNLELSDLLGAESAQLAERLIVDDAEEVRATVRALIDEAKQRVESLNAADHAQRSEAAKEALAPRFDAFGSVSPFAQQLPPVITTAGCPACATIAAVRGERVARGRPRISVDGELIEPTVAVPTRFDCPVCELVLDGAAQLTVAGLGEPVTLLDYPDPIETFDVDIDDYRDQFLQSLADDYAYQDE